MLYYAHHNEAMLLCMHNFPVVENGSPEELLELDDGVFASLVHDHDEAAAGAANTH